jgi:hypothetical protein
MSTFALVHGGCHTPSYWYLLEPELEKLGHQVLKAELPVTDPMAGPNNRTYLPIRTLIQPSGSVRVSHRPCGVADDACDLDVALGA